MAVRRRFHAQRPALRGCATSLPDVPAATRYLSPWHLRITKANNMPLHLDRNELKCKYQVSKVTHHVHSCPDTFTPVFSRIKHIHIEIIGLMLFSQGNRYLLTCVKRSTRWPKATPMAHITTDSVACAFIETWMSRFGVPLSLAFDRDAQFDSQMWSRIMIELGIRCFKTRSYHLQANSMVTRFYRQLKGNRTALKENLQRSSVELVYSSTLRLSGELHASKPTLTP